MKFIQHRSVSYRFFLCIFCSVHFIYSSSIFADDGINRILQTKQINISYNDSARPFSYHLETKHPVGYAIDVCKKVVELLQIKLKIPSLKTNFIATNNNDRIWAIVNDKIDFECSSEPVIDKPKSGIALTQPYFFKRTLMLVKKTSSIQNWEDLARRKISFVLGSDSISLVRDQTKTNLSKSSLLGELSVRIAFDLLATNQVEALISDEVNLYNLKAGSQHADDFIIKGSPLGQQAISIVVNMKNQTLKKMIDNAINKLIRTGELKTIYQQWWMQSLPTHPINYQLPMNPLIINLSEK